MIITISGSPGSGKSTIAAMVAKRFGLNHYSSGDFMRQIARKKKVSMIQLTRIANKNNSVDDEIDEWVSKLAKYEDNFVIDSRLAFFFIPGSIKIFLDVDVKEGAKRILLQRRKDEPENSDLRSTMNNIEKRKESEKKRYRRLYKINPFNKKNYDAYLDTTGISLERVTDSVIKFIESRMKPKITVKVVEKPETKKRLEKKEIKKKGKSKTKNKGKKKPVKKKIKKKSKIRRKTKKRSAKKKKKKKSRSKIKRKSKARKKPRSKRKIKKTRKKQ